MTALKRITQAGTVFAVAYGAGIYYASVNDKFNSVYVKYVPLAGTIIDFLEEREYQNNITARARKAQLDKEEQDSYYYRRSPVNSTSTPLSSSVTSAINSVSSSSSLTSKMTEEQTDEEKLHSSKSPNSSATSATSSRDPLLPKRFFDAVSGTVGGDRDYLPLVLLPDEQDKIMNKAAMSLNALISSFNASAISEETVLSVSKTLADVAQSNASIAPHYAQVIMYKSEKFDRLYRSYRLIWEEYLNTQEQIAGQDTSFKSNPVLADYSRKLSEEIVETELLLVNLINSGKRGHDLDVTDPEYVKFKTSNAALKKKKKAAKQSKAATSSTNFSTSIAQPFRTETSYGGFDATDISLQLKLALTLLVTALQQHSSVPLGPYIQGVREAMAPYPDISNREVLIAEALKTISVPEEVDLKPVLHDILAYDSNKRL